ncbi:hypothetical protein M5689_012195 [Euphorbia peplus]|nr:hypothetical protein M5689_012195 [Euphorbia peplus]
MVGLQKGNSNGNRGANKPYGLMLLLAFGAALLGVMMIHKLRERRIFNLLVKEKDHQLISLQLLLQKEREYTKEMKRKAEEMKTKIYSLRNQNMEADRRILEMQSTIRSLKDERKILESALEERQNKIKANRKKITREKEVGPQVTVLMERLKQKEAEIEDLKRRLESSFRRSSEKYPSNGKPNFNVTGNSVVTETTANQSASGTGENNSNGANPLEQGNRGFDASMNTVESENADRFVNRTESKGGLRVNGENNTAKADEKVVNTGNTDAGTGSGYSREHTVARDEQTEHKKSKQDEGQNEGTLKGAQKLEMADKSRSSTARVEDKYTKEMLWQKLHRNRRLVNNINDETEDTRKRKFPVDNQNQLSKEATVFNKVEELSDAELLKSQKTDDSNHVNNIPVIEDSIHHLEKLQANGSLDDEAAGTRNNATMESYESDLDGVRQYESQENYRDMKMQLNDVKEEMQEEKEDADADYAIDKATGEFARELVPEFEENKEDYKEETEELEF